MPTLASDVMERSAAELNDPGQSLYTDAKLLPYLKQAVDDLTDEFIDNGVGSLKEVSAALSITAGTVDMSSTLPSDVIIPVRMQERTPGQGDDDWIGMVGPSALPVRAQWSSLVHWNWRENQIYFVGATSAREVRLFYRRLFAAVTTAASAIEMPTALSFLAARTAQLAASLQGANPVRARTLYAMSARALASLIRREVRNMGPVRRKRFVPGLK